MQILITAQRRELIVEHNGEELTFTFSVWSSLPSRTTEEIFGPTNEYLATLKRGVLNNMFDGFKRAAELFQEPAEMKVVKETLISCAQQITSELDDSNLMAWAVTYGNINVEPSPVLKSNKPPASMTYTEQESFELSAFCIVAKILTPLLGRYVDEVKGTVHNMHKERAASILFTESNLVNFKAYKRLKLYLEGLAARKEGTPVALRFGTACADMDKYLIGLTVVRRLTIARIRTSQDGAIVAFIYRFLEEKLDELAKKTYRAKFNRDEDGAEATSYADQYRIPEEVASHVIVTTELTLKDIPIIVRDIVKVYPDLDITEREVRRRVNELKSNKEFVITPILHYPLVALIMWKVIHHKMIDKVDREACLIAVAITATVCQLKGFDDVESLLMAQCLDRPVNHLNFNAQNGRTFRRIQKDTEADMRDLYKFLPVAYLNRANTPGKELIEKIVSIILVHDWSRGKIGLLDQSNIRQSIALLLLNRHATHGS